MKAALGLVAGDKSLPADIIAWAKRARTPIVVAGIEGAYAGVADRMFKLAELPQIVGFFRTRKVERVVLAGGVHNARLGFSLPLLAFFMQVLLMKNRYDGALRLVLSKFEKAGIKPVGIQELLPELLAPKGVLTKTKPAEADMRDIKAAAPAARKFAATDKGQSSVMIGGKLISTERWAGTDDLIRRNKGRNAILMKFAKPAQDTRADMPVIGPYTIKSLAAAGFKGAAIEAGKTIIESRAETLRAAERARIWIIGV